MPVGWNSSFTSKPGRRSRAWLGGLMLLRLFSARKPLSPQLMTWLPTLMLALRSPMVKARLTK